MKRILFSSILIISVQILFGQNQIPDNLRTSKVIMVRYSSDDWDGQFLDSTNGKWVLNRYGKDRLFKIYIDAFNKAAATFKKHGIKYLIIDSRSSFNREDFDYVFDYKQKIIDNHESIVADKRLGGFFFENLQTRQRYAPIAENKKYIGRTIKRGL